MSVSEERLLIHTDQLLQKYLQNGTLPDELIIQEQLRSEFAQFIDPITNQILEVNVPLWKPSNITYRSASSAAQWNASQKAAGEDTQILYTDFLQDLNVLTNSLFDYVNRSHLIRSRIANLVSRINNLLLLSTSGEGFLFSFFDNFVDTSKTSFDDPYVTTALVNTATQNVELPVDITTQVSTGVTATNILNLLFLQPNDVRFSVLNPVLSQTGLSSAVLTDIFNNRAIAWQQEITINGPGPLVCELAVKIAPLEPLLINRIELNTKMSNYANQIMVQVLTSEDGVSYTEVNSAANPQFIGQVAEFNFMPVFAAFVKFIITKNTADSGSTYNLGFQYISFQQVQYALSADLFSIPITFPDSRPINKVAIDTCSVEPNGTGITYTIIRNSGTPIPISRTSDTEPVFPKIINLGALTDVRANIFSTSGPIIWTPEPSGRLSVNVSGLVGNVPIDIQDITIANTLEIFRDLGGPVAAQPSGNAGWQANPSGLPVGYFQSYMDVSNVGGTQFDLGNNQSFIDRRLTNGAITLNQNLHTIATTAFDQLQELVAANSDIYFAWNMQFKSTFEFYNNFSVTDPTIFTYDSNSGKVIINNIPELSQAPLVDFAASFVGTPANDGTFISSGIVINTSSFTAPVTINAGGAISITVGPNPQWVNEIQVRLNTNTDTTIDINYSNDNVNWLPILANENGPLAGTSSFGAIRFPVPVYAKYLQIVIDSGSNVNMTSGFVQLYPPVFLQPGFIQTKTIFLPSASIWETITDGSQVNTAQTYKIYDAFSNALIQEYSTTAWVANITGLYRPMIYAIVASNDPGLDPYIFNVTLDSDPLVNEASRILFSYLAPGSTNVTNSIRFSAHLTSIQPGLTPQLSSYRVKLL